MRNLTHFGRQANDEFALSTEPLTFEQRQRLVDAIRRQQARDINHAFAVDARAVWQMLRIWVVEPIAGYLQRARERAELGRSSDHQLADIGLTRGQLPGQVYATRRDSDEAFIPDRGRKPARFRTSDPERDLAA